MRVSECIGCDGFACQAVNHAGFRVPAVEVDPQKVSVVLISEAAAPDAADDYYAPGSPLFARTTVQAFQDAGAGVASIEEILRMGVYLTTAVKCSKMGYVIPTQTIDTCALILERELDLFPNVKAYLLMGDAAIRAVNTIAMRARQPRVIPAGSTYKIRGGRFIFRGSPAFPSYLQAGPSFFIEKVKRKMIAEDISAVMALL